MQIGYKLATEAFGPSELIRQTVLAEQSGFDFVEMSDHYHPWLEEQGHASFTAEQATAQFACGPDAGRHLEVARQFADAGFDHLVALNAGPDPDGFMDFFARELAEPLRALQPGGAGVRDPG